MSIEAVYAVNEYMKAALTTASLDCGQIYPGKFAPSVENGVKFVTYSVIPSDTYDLAGLKNDSVMYRFYNPDFNELHKVVGVVARTFNVYDIQKTSLAETGVIFQETFFRVMGDGEASYAEGVEYYFLICDLMLKYTEDMYAAKNMGGFIQGV